MTILVDIQLSSEQWDHIQVGKTTECGCSIKEKKPDHIITMSLCITHKEQVMLKIKENILSTPNGSENT